MGQVDNPAIIAFAIILFLGFIDYLIEKYPQWKKNKETLFHLGDFDAENSFMPSHWNDDWNGGDDL